MRKGLADFCSDILKGCEENNTPGEEVSVHLFMDYAGIKEDGKRRVYDICTIWCKLGVLKKKKKRTGFYTWLGVDSCREKIATKAKEKKYLKWDSKKRRRLGSQAMLVAIHLYNNYKRSFGRSVLTRLLAVDSSTRTKKDARYRTKNRQKQLKFAKSYVCRRMYDVMNVLNSTGLINASIGRVRTANNNFERRYKWNCLNVEKRQQEQEEEEKEAEDEEDEIEDTNTTSSMIDGDILLPHTDLSLSVLFPTIPSTLFQENTSNGDDFYIMPQNVFE